MEIVWSAPALRDLRGIDQNTAERIPAQVRRYATTQHGDVRKFGGMDECYRLRVGDYRVVRRPDRGRLVIVVLHVGHRGDVYKG